MDGYEIHPGLLDACFQTLGLLPSWAGRGELLLPFAVAELQLIRAGGGASNGETWWCHTQQVGAEQWDLRLYDEAGQVVAVVQGFQLRAMSAAALQGSSLRREWLYSLEWQAEPLGASVESGDRAGVLAGGRGSGWLVWGTGCHRAAGDARWAGCAGGGHGGRDCGESPECGCGVRGHA